jgi:hypothetical protein
MNCDLILTTAPSVAYENQRGKRVSILRRPNPFRNLDEPLRDHRRWRFTSWTSIPQRVHDVSGAPAPEPAAKIDFPMATVHALA